MSAANAAESPTLEPAAPRPPLPPADAAELASLAAQAATGEEGARSVLDRFTSIVNRHQEQPQLLDPHLPAVIPPLASALLAVSARGDAAAAAAIGRVLWAAASARGRKAALRFFPQAASAFEPVARLLAGAAGVAVQGEAATASGCPWAAMGAQLGSSSVGGGGGGGAAPGADPGDRPVGGGRGGGEAPPPPSSSSSPLETWPARCCLLLWLAQSATVPFPMASLDPTGSGMGGRSAAVAAAGGGAWAAPVGPEPAPPADDDSTPALHAHPDWDATHASSCPAAYDRLTAGVVGDGGGGGGGGGGGDDAPHSSSWPALARAAEAACRASLASPGADREAAILALGRLLARPDADAADGGRRLTRFVGWAAAVAGAGGSGGGSAATAAAASAVVADVRALGATAALAQVFARAERRALVPVAPAAWRAAEAVLSCNGGGRRPGVQARRAAVKLAARAALASLPAAAGPASAAPPHPPPPLPPPARVEAAAAALVSALRDRDTAVRWSAAKGLARVAAALHAAGPAAGAGPVDAIAAACLGLCDPAEPDAAWHGGCLALAALLLAGGRQGGGRGPAASLFPRPRLPALIAAAASALAYDVRRGGAGVGVGAHVRDAGAYVAWALARAGLAGADLAAAAAPLAAPLVATAAFDREVNCRRAAAAAFQELAGRCGPDAPSFAPAPLGVAAALDFYGLASARLAALRVGPALAALGGPYPAWLAGHLTASKAAHWCRATRDLAGEALAAVCVAGVGAGCASPAAGAAAELAPRLAPGAPPEARAGAAGALAALVAGGDAAAPSPATLAHLVATLPATAPALVRGRGGEAVREGVLALVAALAGAGAAAAPVAAAAAAAAAAAGEGEDGPGGASHSILSFIEANLRHPAAPVREGAAAALGALAGAAAPLGPGWAPPSPDAALLFTSWLPPSAPVEARRGGAAALGALPPRYLAPHGEAVVAALAAAVRLEADPGVRDAEARAAAAAALGRVCLGPPLLPPAAAAAALDALLAGAADYATDRRGDVGSWVRRPAAAGGAALVLALGRADPTTAASLSPPLLASLVRLACERLARLRAEARAHLEALVSADEGRQGGFLGPAGAALRAALAESRAAASSPASSPSAEDLSLAAALLARPSLPPPLAAAAITGLSACVGGLDAPLSRAAGRALVAAAAGAAGPGHVLDALLAAWAAAASDPRLATPWVRAADALLAGLEHGACEAALGGSVAAAAADGSSPPRAAALLSLALAAARGCRDPPRLGAVAGLLCHLAGLGSGATAPTAAAALGALAGLLGHAYPTVRRGAAEALCVRLVCGVPAVQGGGGGADIDAAADLLAATAWDGDARAARAARAGVCRALGVVLGAGAAPAGKENEEEEEEEEAAARGLAAAKAAAGDAAGYQAFIDAVERGTA